MINSHITQWHNPRECSAACNRVENVMMNLKALVRSFEQEEAGLQPSKITSKLPTPAEKKLEEELRFPYPMRPHYRYPEALGDIMSQCPCDKRNGLQDYCGGIGHKCYMNPKKVLHAGSRVPENQIYSYQNERNKLRCEGGPSHHDWSQEHPVGMHGHMERSHQPPRDCIGENCINDFYLIPVERPH